MYNVVRLVENKQENTETETTSNATVWTVGTAEHTMAFIGKFRLRNRVTKTGASPENKVEKEKINE